MGRHRQGGRLSFFPVVATQPRPGAAVVSSPLVPVRPAVLEPLAPGRYKVQFTASAGLRDKLERLRALMRASFLVDEHGRRCPERRRLEFHHLVPFGYGGDHSPGNVQLTCPGHNQFLAERDYGEEVMARHRSGLSSSPPGGARTA